MSNISKIVKLSLNRRNLLRLPTNSNNLLHADNWPTFATVFFVAALSASQYDLLRTLVIHLQLKTFTPKSSPNLLVIGGWGLISYLLNERDTNWIRFLPIAYIKINKNTFTLNALKKLLVIDDQTNLSQSDLPKIYSFLKTKLPPLQITNILPGISYITSTVNTLKNANDKPIDK